MSWLVLTVLQFVLQCDFILSASRQQIADDCPWNDTLISAAEDLFVQSVQTFNSLTFVKYTWSRWLQAEATPREPFDWFLPDLVARLRNIAIIEAQDSSMKAPTYMELLPPSFTDGASPAKPLISGVPREPSYPATYYHAILRS